MPSTLELKKAVVALKREMVEDLVVDLKFRSANFTPKESVPANQLDGHIKRFNDIMRLVHQAQGLVAQLEKDEAELEPPVAK